MSSTVKNAIRIINCFSSTKKEIGLSEIARSLGMHKSTVYHLVKTLREEGVLVQNENNNMYMLGMKLFEWASLVSARDQIVNIVIPYIHNLVNLSGETVHLGVMKEDEAIIVAKSGTPSAIQIATRPGSTIPLHCTSIGKILLANQKETQVEEYLSKNDLKRYSAKTIISKDKLRAQLKEVRQVRYAIDDSEYIEGYYSIAAKITDLYGECFGAISVGGPKQKILRMEKQLIRSLLSTVDIISDSISQSMSENYLNTKEEV